LGGARVQRARQIILQSQERIKRVTIITLMVHRFDSPVRFCL